MNGETKRVAVGEPLGGSELLARVMEMSPTATVVMDRDGRFIYANAQAERVLGRSKEQITQLSYNASEWHFTVPAGQPFPEGHLPFWRVKQTGCPEKDVRLAIQWPNGDRRQLTISAAPILDEVGLVSHVVTTLEEAREGVGNEHAMRGSEERYRQLFESVNDAVLLRPIAPKGPGGSFVEVNGVACQMLGYSREELQRLCPADIDPEVTPELIEARAKQLLGHGGVIFQTRLRAKDGSRVPVEISSHLFEWHGQQMSLSVVRDLSDRRAAEAALRESERRLREMMENVRLIAIMLDTEGKVMFANQFLLQLTGWRIEEVIGQDWFGLFIPSNQSVQRKHTFHSQIQGSLLPHYENEIVTRIGECRLIAWNNTPLENADGKIIGVACIGEDITERKRAEQALLRSEENLRSIFSNAPVGIYQSTIGRLLAVNPAMAAMFGYDSPAEMLASSVSPSGFFVDLEQRGRIIRAALESGTYTQQEVDYRRKDGTIFTANLRMRAVRDESGQVRFLEGFAEDITEKKRLEEELAVREERLNSFFNNATAGLCILDADLRYVQINETLAGINGIAVGDHIGKTIGEVLPKLASALEPFLQQILKRGEPVLNQQIRGETIREPGVIRHWMGSYFPLLDDAGQPGAVGCVIVEVTEQKRAEEKLRESEEKFRQLAENIHKVFWICDKETKEMLYVSPAYEEIWGRSCRSLYEQPGSFAEAIHPADRDRMMEAIQRERRGEGYEEEYRILRPDGSVRWIHDRSFAIVNEQGEFYRLAGLAEDITERKLLEDQLRQAQKMEAIGQLAGGVAHDFNNILSGTLMHLGLLQQNPHLTGGTKESLRELERETIRAANLTRQLLLFSRRQAANPILLDMNEVVNDLLKMLRRLLGENIDVVFAGSLEPVWVSADAGMMEQVVMNLCINARDAMPKGGRLKIATATVDLDPQSTQPYADARPGNFVCLTVSDTGCGMDASVLGRIFEPFFTTKEVGKGTGLGLATVYGIVKQHEGWVEVDSTVGEGSSFRVYLPAGSKPAGQIESPGGAEEMTGGSETILLVEDELPLRRTAALCLRKLGYAVLEAGDGVEALKVWEQHRERIALLLTDMVMPEKLTGLDLAELLTKEKGSLKVIVSSGYSADLAEPHRTAGSDVAFLPKPYKTAALAKAVRRSLDGG